MDQSPTTLAEDRGPLTSDWTTADSSARRIRTTAAQTAPPGSRVASCAPNGSAASNADAADAAPVAARTPTALSSDLAPFDSSWTVADLLAWLSDDARTHDPTLRHPLSLVDRALSGTAWTGAPSTVALIRSIAEAVRHAPELRSVRVQSLLA